MSRLPLLIGSALVALLVASPSAWACSCAGPAPGEKREFYKQALKRADGAVVVRVKDVRAVEDESDVPDGEPAPSYGETVYVLRVRRAFKRFRQFPEGRVLRIKTSSSGAACGLGMRRGQVDGLFLDRHRGRLTASLCSRVRPRQLRRAARSRGGTGRDGGGASMSASPCGGSA